MKKFRCPICETFMKKISTQSGIKWHCEQCGYESPTFKSAIKLKKVERAGSIEDKIEEAKRYEWRTF